MDSFKEKVKNGFKLITSIEIIRYAIELFIIIFTARILSPDDFGLVASALVVIALTDSFTQFGISTPIIQFIEDSIIYINTAWTIDLVRSFIIFIFLFIFSEKFQIISKMKI